MVRILFCLAALALPSFSALAQVAPDQAAPAQVTLAKWPASGPSRTERRRRCALPVQSRRGRLFCGSTCAPARSRCAAGRSAGWACLTVPDDRAAFDQEIARLQNENVALKKALLERGLPLPGGVTSDRPTARGGEGGVKPPGDAEFDRMIVDRRAGLAPAGRDDRKHAKGQDLRHPSVDGCQERAERRMARLSSIVQCAPEIVATRDAERRHAAARASSRSRARQSRFIAEAGAGDGVLLLFCAIRRRRSSSRRTPIRTCEPISSTALRAPRARRCRLGARHRGTGRHAGACEDDADGDFAACTGDRGRSRHSAPGRAIYVAEHRAQRASARDRAAVHRHSPLALSDCSDARSRRRAAGRHLRP